MYNGLINHIQHTTEGVHQERSRCKAWPYALVLGLCVGFIAGVSI